MHPLVEVFCAVLDFPIHLDRLDYYVLHVTKEGNEQCRHNLSDNEYKPIETDYEQRGLSPFKYGFRIRRLPALQLSANDNHS
jgi:hypothetical protein